MARIRTIKPDFFRSGSLAKCSRDARLTFAGLWTEADDLGRGEADPRLIKGALWPLDDDITAVDIGRHLDELQDTGHIRMYVVDGDPYYEVAKWDKHQAAAYRRGEAKHPAPPEDWAPPPPKGLHDQSCKEVQDASSWSGRGVQEVEGTTDASQHNATHQQPVDKSSSVDQLAQLWAEHIADHSTFSVPRERFVNGVKRNKLAEERERLERVARAGIADADALDVLLGNRPAPVAQAWYEDPHCQVCDGTGVARDEDDRFGPCECRRSEPYMATVHQLRGASA